MAKLGITLEIELGVTGGEEDGVDNTGVDESRLYTQPEEVAKAYSGLTSDQSQFYRGGGLWKCSWSLQAWQCSTQAHHLEGLARIHSEKARNGTEAGELRLSRRLWFVT